MATILIGIDNNADGDGDGYSDGDGYCDGDGDDGV